MADERLREIFNAPASIDEWLAAWRTRLAQEGQGEAERMTAMRSVNPAFIPRNHRIERVIVAAQSNGDFAPLDEFLTVLARPYDDQPGFERYADSPKPEEIIRQTFCGT
jgi:uncharacterized protein YdiU (UPF0061 family)